MVERRRAKRLRLAEPAGGATRRVSAVSESAAIEIPLPPNTKRAEAGAPALTDQPRAKLRSSRSAQVSAWSIVSPPCATRAIILVLIAWL